MKIEAYEYMKNLEQPVIWYITKNITNAEPKTKNVFSLAYQAISDNRRSQTS